MASELFTPIPGGTITVVATAASVPTALYAKGYQVRVKNIDATATVYIAFGTATVTTTSTADCPIGPGDIAGFSVDPNTMTHVACISSATSSTIYFTKGNGT